MQNNNTAIPQNVLACMEQIPPQFQLLRWIQTKQSGFTSCLPFSSELHSPFPFDTTMFHSPTLIHILPLEDLTSPLPLSTSH